MPVMATAAARIAAASRSATATAIATDAAAAAAAATAAVTSESLGIAPDQGDANHREEDRDAEQESTIHPKILQQTGTYRKIEQTGRLSNDSPS